MFEVDRALVNTLKFYSKVANWHNDVFAFCSITKAGSLARTYEINVY